MFRLPKMFFKHWVGGRDSPSKNDLFYGEHESPRSCFSNLSRDLTCQQRTSPPLSFSGLFGRFCDRSLTVPFSFPPFPDRSLKVSLNKPCSERYRFPRSLTVPFRFPSSPPLRGERGTVYGGINEWGLGVSCSVKKETDCSVFFFSDGLLVIVRLRCWIRFAVFLLTYWAPRRALQLAHDPTMFARSYGSPPWSNSVTWSACVLGARLHQ